jgi:CHAT domain-containing protein
MGVTRALFGAGTGDLIAGAWTVVSPVAAEFARHFYDAWLAGRPVAGAMLAARQAVAALYPDPFHWGVFVQQGANLRRTEGADGHGH